MIDELGQERATAYLLGELSLREERLFVQELETNPELAAWVNDLESTLGAVAKAVPQYTPAAALRAQVLASLAAPRTARAKVIPPAPRFSFWHVLFGPEALWAKGLLSLFILTTLLLAYAAHTLSNEVKFVSRHYHHDHEKLYALEAELADSREKYEALQKQNTLDQVEIATLKSQTPALKSVQLVVVWDAKTQKGVIDLKGLPTAAAGKDYQLWIIDPNYASPVSAGLVAAQADGAITNFKPALPIHGSGKFAISLEKAGGSDVPAGPILFIGS